MDTRTFLLSAGIFIMPLFSSAQTMLWPVAGEAAGEKIICKPQDFIDDELNYSDLFISGSEGDYIICPTDGTITALSVIYRQSLTYQIGSGMKPDLTLDENIAAADLGKGTSRRYYTGAVSIRLQDGNKIHLTGLAGKFKFKTGQKLSAGDTLGVIGYSYKSIKTPSITISLSDKAGQGMDPMTPFGLKSTFIKAGGLTRDNPMSVEKTREDLEILKKAYCDLYPSLDRRMPKEEFVAYMDSLKMSVTAPISPDIDFRMLLRQFLSKFPDSHSYLYPDPLTEKIENVWTPGEFLMFCDDTVRVLISAIGMPQNDGKAVESINGIPAKDYAKRAEVFVSNHDGKITSTAEETNVLLGRYGMLMNPDAKKGSVHELVFSDGSVSSVPFAEHPGFMQNDMFLRINRWYHINVMKDEDDVFETRLLNDSTSYLAIRTFDMPDAQVEQIIDFLVTCKTSNLIVDMRNNSGGSGDVLMQLLACLTDAPMDRQRGGYGRVKIQGKVPILDYSMNYSSRMDMFPEYDDRGDGYYYSADTVETCSTIVPCAGAHYDGRVYALTNGHSFSAATLFPAVLVRNRRGVSVGRETGSGYHYMTAYKFADIRLPNSLQTIRIPLVQLVFDSTVCDRLPEERGLLPDYPLPLTYNEVTGGADGKTDVMLDYALSLIADGHYLSEDDPFAESGSGKGLPSNKVILLIVFSVLVVIAASVGAYYGSRMRRSGR